MNKYFIQNMKCLYFGMIYKVLSHKITTMTNTNWLWEKKFSEMKNIIFKHEDRAVMAKSHWEKQYLHETLPEIDLANESYTPAWFAIGRCKEGAIDAREVLVIDETYTQSQVMKQFIRQVEKQARSDERQKMKQKTIEIVETHSRLWVPHAKVQTDFAMIKTSINNL